jgi:DNA mismatch repair protein MutS2
LKFYPESSLTQLEYNKVKALIKEQCQSEYAMHQADKMEPVTRLPHIMVLLQQTAELKLLVQNGAYFNIQANLAVQKEVKLLSLPGARLAGEQFLAIKKLCLSAEDIFKWFTAERVDSYPNLAMVIKDSYYEKVIKESIDDVLDERGNVMDNASKDLFDIRIALHKKRNELRRVFDKIVSKLNKAGYVTEIEESYLNSRRVVAIFAENKRQVKGILHGESDTRKTAFIEPEETIELNNDIYSLENEERREVNKILLALTASLSMYAPLLKQYYNIIGIFDFIRAKATIAINMDAHLPMVEDKSTLNLKKAYHPLLRLYNQKQGKPTIPTNITLNAKDRILIISGPNAGGKTVTLKTIGLLQLMLQSGLLVPVDPTSTMGIFKQLMIHIGDTQSIEFELSTYSSHLKNMKHFIENANGRTLFFIDELGGGSDPNLGGAFAEVILEELANKHAIGIVTTHYLNLKVMANKVAGLVNGSMLFDEEKLQPLYTLQIGKPGSSYTFSIAERIGLEQRIINRAKKLADSEQYNLDKLLNNAEQTAQKVVEQKKELDVLLQQQERLNTELKIKIKQETHRQEVEKLKLQNKQTEQKYTELKELERKIKQAVFEWKKTKNKSEAINNMETLLFYKKAKAVEDAAAKKFAEHYQIIGGPIKINDKVRMKSTNQVALVKDIGSTNKATIQLGMLPLTVDIDDLEVVQELDVEVKNKSRK